MLVRSTFSLRKQTLEADTCHKNDRVRHNKCIKAQGDVVRIPRKAALIAAGSALVTVTAISVAAAGSGASSSAGAGTPKGPYIDFCPTLEQAEAHLAEYGFDYKPTVVCGEDGTVISSDTGSEQALTDEEALAKDKALLTSAKRLPDSDGDPTTMEIELPDGTEGIIYINTGDPDHYRDMSPADFANEVYP